MSEQCSYTAWYVDKPCLEMTVLEATGQVDRTCESGLDLTEFRCTELALANGRCSVHLDAGDGPGA